MESHSNGEIAFYIAAKMQFDQLKNLSDAVVSLRIGHILNPSFQLMVMKKCR